MRSLVIGSCQHNVFRHWCKYFYVIVLVNLFVPQNLLAQNDIPIGSWRMHLSYSTINTIAVSGNKIYGASNNGIMVLDKSDNSIDTYSKLNGLTGAGISFINFNSTTKQLVVAYSDGNLDIIKDNQVTNFDRLKTSTAISTSKKINHINFDNAVAYISTDYGVVVFDLLKDEVKETWRDLSSTGANLKINQSVILGDSIFLATEKGILAGNLNDNLLDFNNWKRFDQNTFATNIPFITSFNNIIVAALSGFGIYFHENGGWANQTYLQSVAFSSLTSSVNHLFITEGSNLWTIDINNQITQIVDPLISKPLFVMEDNNKLWIGDFKNGMISYTNGTAISYLPNGPKNSTTNQLKYHNGVIYNLPGGFSSGFIALNNDKGYDVFNNSVWSNETASLRDVTDIDFWLDKTYLSSFGYGVEEKSESGSVVYNEMNSSLVNLNPPGKFVNVTAIAGSSQGLWVTNYGTSNSLHLLDKNGSWSSFSFPTLATRYPLDLLIDDNGFVWVLLNPLQGGGILVFDRENNRSVYLTDVVGAGGLPSKSVRSIALDRDGYVWVGTDAGVAYFIDSYDIFSTSVDAIKPIFDNRFLLKSEKITSIAVDGGNRKWMGTENGVWLFNSTGEEMVYNFTEQNSALISNAIKDVEINQMTGEVFFATDKGIISYRSGATEATSDFGKVKIFPNPVTSSFSGTIGISGLAADAIVKITDITGKLVWQTQASGGTATWGLQSVNGYKVETGIYLVFAAAQDASSSIVGKIAIVE